MNGKIGIIGLGRLGASLLKGLLDEGRQNVAVFSKTYKDEYKDFDFQEDMLKVIEMSETIFVCVNDDSLEMVSKEIADSNLDLKNKIFIHFSGIKPSSVFSNLKLKGSKIASLHPIQTFPTTCSQKAFYKTDFALEGDDLKKHILNIFSCFEPEIFYIDPSQKAKYHAAAVISCNLMCMLLDISDELLKDCEIKKGINVHEKLIESTIDNIMLLGPGKALTGPAVRGDLESLKTHMDILSGDDRKIYMLLTKKALETGRKFEMIDEKKYNIIIDEIQKIFDIS